MGPLVYYCRWRGAKLRLHGRDEDAVWGELITREGGPNRFALIYCRGSCGWVMATREGCVWMRWASLLMRRHRPMS